MIASRLSVSIPAQILRRTPRLAVSGCRPSQVRFSSPRQLSWPTGSRKLENRHLLQGCELFCGISNRGGPRRRIQITRPRSQGLSRHPGQFLASLLVGRSPQMFLHLPIVAEPVGSPGRSGQRMALLQMAGLHCSIGNRMVNAEGFSGRVV